MKPIEFERDGKVWRVLIGSDHDPDALLPEQHDATEQDFIDAINAMDDSPTCRILEGLVAWRHNRDTFGRAIQEAFARIQELEKKLKEAEK